MEQVIETFFNKILELFRDAIQNGIPELHIPPLDPLEIPGRKDISIKSFALNLDGNFRELTVKGLSKIAVPKLELKDKTAKANATTKLEITGKYTLNGKAMKVVTIASDSDFTCGIDPLTVKIGLNYKDTNDLKAIVELKSGDIKLTLNDFPHPKAANAVLKAVSGVLAKFVEESVGPALQNALQKLIDQHKGEIAT